MSPEFQSDVEVIPIQKVNEAYARLVKSDVKYRFSIDIASLKAERIFFNKTGFLLKKMIIQDQSILPFHFACFNEGHIQNAEQ